MDNVFDAESIIDSYLAGALWFIKTLWDIPMMKFIVAFVVIGYTG